MKRLSEIVRKVCAYSEYPGVVMIVGWVFVFAGYVLTRKLGMTWVFVEEYTGYWLVFLAYVPLASTLLSEGHTRTDILIGRLPDRVARVLTAVTDSIAFLLVTYLLVRSVQWVAHAIALGLHSQTNLHTPLWPMYGFVSIGLGLFAAALFVRAAEDVVSLWQARRLIESPQGDTDRRRKEMPHS